MTYLKIDSDYINANYSDGQSLPSALAKRLINNVDHSLKNRLKKTVVNYNGYGYGDITMYSARATDNSNGYFTNLGLTYQKDDNTRGLQFSTPPGECICIPPVLFPLSSKTKKLKFTIAMAAEQASVEVYAFARLGDRFFGLPPDQVSYLDSDGILQFSDDAKTGNNYVEVTTAKLTNKLFMPVELTLNVNRAAVSDLDYGKHSSGDSSEQLEIFFCFHSKQGSIDFTAKADSSANFPLGGYGGALLSIREIDGTYAGIATAGPSYYNPSTYHRWIKIDEIIDGLPSNASNIPGIRYFKHVVQLRPRDSSNLNSGGAVFAIYPPLDSALSGFAEGAGLSIYECGLAKVGSITIQEVEGT